jgi:RNA polymerase sigma-70 factor (ECF subfamily)
MMQDSDKDLMKRVVNRNTDAFKILYQRYESSIFNFILRYTGTKEIAQDLLQETFTRVWFAAHTFDLRAGNFKGWLFKIALNTTRNEMSKKRYDYHFFGVAELSGSSEEPAHSDRERPDVKFEQSELKKTIGDALGRLPPFLREIIILKHYHQLKFREIAQITNTPEGTLKARFHRAIAQLKELLEPMDL